MGKEYVTVSARVSKEIWEKAKRYKINVSEVIRRALEIEAKRREIEWAISVMDDISRREQLERPSWQILKEFREKV